MVSSRLCERFGTVSLSSDLVSDVRRLEDDMSRLSMEEEFDFYVRVLCSLKHANVNGVVDAMG